MRTTLDTRLERLLYALARDDVATLDAAETTMNQWSMHSVTAGLRAQALALEFAREQIDQEMRRDR